MNGTLSLPEISPNGRHRITINEPEKIHSISLQ